MRNLLAVFLLFPLIMAGTAIAQYGYGTSSISLNPNGASTAAGSSVQTSYTVNLASGNTWGTTLGIANQGSLSSQGITVSLSDSSGDPPFSGTATIAVSPSAKPGTYEVTFQASGDDPSGPTN